MPNETPAGGSRFGSPERAKGIENCLAALRTLAAKTPAIKACADVIAITRTPMYGKTLATLLDYGHPYNVVLDGYVLARLAEFADVTTRAHVKYHRKDADKCIKDVYQHAKTHLGQALGMNAPEEQRPTGSPGVTGSMADALDRAAKAAG